jgi:predicted cobalt transporter CbtA
MTKVTQAVVLLAVVCGLLATGVLAASQAYQDTPTTVETVGNESLVQDVGNWTAVEASGGTGVTGFYDNETVRNSSGDVLTEGEDYEWDAESGSIRFFESSSTEDGSNASISYAYDRRPEQATAMIGPVATMFDVAGILPLVVALLAVLAGLDVLRSSTSGGSYGGRR